MEEETVMGPELDDLIASLRPDFDFFGRRNIRTEQEPPKAEEPPTQDKRDDVKDDDSDHDAQTKDPDPQTPDSEARIVDVEATKQSQPGEPDDSKEKKD